MFGPRDDLKSFRALRATPYKQTRPDSYIINQIYLLRLQKNYTVWAGREASAGRIWPAGRTSATPDLRAFVY